LSHPHVIFRMYVSFRMQRSFAMRNAMKVLSLARPYPSSEDPSWPQQTWPEHRPQQQTVLLRQPVSRQICMWLFGWPCLKHFQTYLQLMPCFKSFNPAQSKWSASRMKKRLVVLLPWSSMISHVSMLSSTMATQVLSHAWEKRARGHHGVI